VFKCLGGILALGAGGGNVAVPGGVGAEITLPRSHLVEATRGELVKAHERVRLKGRAVCVSGLVRHSLLPFKDIGGGAPPYIERNPSTAFCRPTHIPVWVAYLRNQENNSICRKPYKGNPLQQPCNKRKNTKLLPTTIAPGKAESRSIAGPIVFSFDRNQPVTDTNLMVTCDP